MSPNEVLVVVVFGLIGYWIVSALISPNRNSAQGESHASEPGDRNSQGSKNNSSVHNSEDMATNWFNILDVPQTASSEMITSAYKRKISQYHPDKVASLGDELKDLAEAKSKQINTAYNYIKKIRNC